MVEKEEKCPCFLAHTDSCKLSELEKKIGDINKTIDNRDIIPKGWAKSIDGYSKLKKQIDVLKLNQMDGTPNQNFVAIHILKNGLTQIGLKWDNWTNKIEDILRELNELMRDLVSDLQDSNSLSKATIKCYEGKLVKNLEKLDSKPKKEIPSECLRTCSECQKIFESIELRKNHEALIHGIGIYKDSEGEKTVLDLKKGQNPQQLCEKCKFESDCPHAHADTIDMLGCDSYEEKEFEFQLVKKFIPPRGIHCEDCMNNPVPKLIKKFLERFNWILERIEFHTGNPDSELMDEISEEYKKWEERIK